MFGILLESVLNLQSVKKENIISSMQIEDNLYIMALREEAYKVIHARNPFSQS